MRRATAFVLAGWLVLAACSDRDDNGGSGASASVSLASATATSASSRTTDASSGVTTSGTYGVVVTSPTDGADVAEPLLVCVVVTAAPDPGDLEVEVRLEDPSPPPEAGPPIRQAVHAGVATVRVVVDLSATGRHDLRVRLLRGGAAIDGAEDVVQDVVIAGDRGAGGTGSC